MLGQKNRLMYIGIFLLAFWLPQGTILQTMSPFGVAFLAVLPLKEAVIGMIGACMGYWFLATEVFAVRYIAAAIVLVTAKWAINPNQKLHTYPYISIWLAGISMLFTGLVSTIVAGANVYDIVLCLCEVVVACGVTFFFMKTRTLLQNKISLRALSQTDLSCLAVSIAVALTSLSGVQISVFSLGNIAAVFIILFFSFVSRESGGTIAGVFTGAALSLSGGQFFLTGSFAFGGLLAGIFSVFGRFALVASFIIGNSLLMLTMAPVAVNANVLYDVLVATAIFMLIPSKALNRYMILQAAQSEYTPQAIRDNVVMKLDYASQALVDIKEAVKAVGEKLKEMISPDITSVYSQTADKICKKCNLRLYCWETAGNETYNALNDVTRILRKKTAIEKEDLPDYFLNRCLYPADFTAQLNRNYKEYQQKMASLKRVGQLRAVVADQYEAIGMMLSELSEEIASFKQFDSLSARKAVDYLLSQGFEVLGCCAFFDQNGRLTIEMSLNAQKRIAAKLEEITEELSALCMRAFEVPTPVEEHNAIRLVFFEKLNYSMQFGAYQICHKESRFCGDAYVHFSDHRGHAYMVLSDGMGSGGRAAVDSNMTVALFSRLIQSGFAFGSAVKLVNSSLMIKSPEESLSTLDVVGVDLYSGKGEFLKAGGAPTFVLHEGKVQVIDKVSMPVGILSQTGFACENAQLFDNDLVVSVSDGVTNEPEEWISQELIRFGAALTPQVLAKRLAQEAKRRRPEQMEDDITVVVGRVSRCE